ncbi:MAG: UvrD-helicase domain-containing protein [Chromatiaceae bacterium]|nr:UvrD-helicase domain-containing protein [Chromatiaceae bacterium]MCP5421392.1 UvrD-helicase domain-containing protein [Chromatiaceae bacterium]
MTEHIVSDAAQRARALDVTTSFIVQAPAGSGKTELLTQRYLRLLAQVSHPEEICAITFTRKAAAEMRNRVLGALDHATGDEPAQAHARLTWRLARAALSHANELEWQLADNPNRLRIQTFDSLAHALARQLPLLTEFGAPPTTTEQAEPYYRAAARATLRQLDDIALGPHLARLLVHLDNRLAQIEDLLTTMLARRDQWLGPALQSPDGEALEDALRTAVEDTLRALRAGCDPTWLTELCRLAAWAAANREAGNGLSWHDREALPESTWDELPAWQALADLLLTRDGKPRRAWDTRTGFPAPGKARDPATRQRYQQAKNDIAALVEPLAADDDRRTAWDGVRRLPPDTLAPGQHAVLGSLLQVLLHAAKELILAFRDGGEVDFAETQMRAQRALGSPEEPTDFALALDYRLQHLLVDEFQDTSSSQYQLLATLTATWRPGDGRTLFAVGDPMQSIYRFREAEVGLYLAARTRGIGQLALEPLTLAVNFRSSTDVVDWVNACFSGIFPREVDIARGAVTYAPSSAFNPGNDGAAVQVHPFVGRDDGGEARLVVRLIRTALAESDDGTVAVLARARSHLHVIARALNDAGLRYQAVEIATLGDQPVVRDLYHLTRALLHPADRLAWLVVLRAPWLGLDLADLLLIAEHAPACLLGRLRDPAVRTRLSDDGRQRVERLLATVDPQLPARGRRPLRQWIEGIWLQLGGLAAAGADALADAQAYLALLDRFAEADGLTDFARLEAAINALYASPDGSADGRVQLMTMHKAKGLEFDTVILPGLGRAPRAQRTELLYWLERPDRNGRVTLLMAPIRGVAQTQEPVSGYLRELDRDKTRLEITRLLYVAATRAKRRLHLIGHVNADDQGGHRPPTGDSLLEKLWPLVGERFAASVGTAPASVPPLDAAIASRLGVDWQPPSVPVDPSAGPADGEPPTESSVEFDWAGDTARHVGTLVHRHLERIATRGVDVWHAGRIDGLAASFRLALRNLGVADHELDGAVAKTQRALARTLDDPTGRWILAAHADARSEWALTVVAGGARRFVIDRTFVDAEGVRWIIDYKTGEHLGDDHDGFLDREQQRYREQLENYARIVRLFDPRPIRLALFFPLFPAMRSWDFGE